MLAVFIFKDFIYLFFRERGREKEREGEKHQCVAASHTPPAGDLAHNPGICPGWESNWQPFSLQACAQSTELHQLGHWLYLMFGYRPFTNKFYDHQHWTFIVLQLYKQRYIKNKIGRDSVAQLVGASSCSQKVSGSIPSWDMCLGCWFDPRSRSVLEATNQCFSLWSMFLSLLSSLPSPLSKSNEGMFLGED